MVSLSLDTPELAAKYDIVGQRQFSHGKLLVNDLPLRIELAKQKAPAHLQVSVGNAEDLSAFRPNGFDVVYLVRLERHLIFAVAEKVQTS